MEIEAKRGNWGYKMRKLRVKKKQRCELLEMGWRELELKV